MKLTIDTTNDSKEDIRKAIRLLMSLVAGHDVQSNEEPQPIQNLFETKNAPDVPSMMSMFDNIEQPKAQEKSVKKSQPMVEFF